jgi:hypothetical protein
MARKPDFGCASRAIQQNRPALTSRQTAGQAAQLKRLFRQKSV